MELHLFETAISLLFILHIEDLDELECDYSLIRYSLRFENIREFTLPNKLLNFKSIYDHAHMEHNVIACVRLVRINFLRGHLRLNS